MPILTWWQVLAAGALLGWVAMWIMDTVFWRRRAREDSVISGLRQELTLSEVARLKLVEERAQIRQAEQERDEVRAEMERERETLLAQLQEERAAWEADRIAEREATQVALAEAEAELTELKLRWETGQPMLPIEVMEVGPVRPLPEPKWPAGVGDQTQALEELEAHLVRARSEMRFLRSQLGTGRPFMDELEMLPGITPVLERRLYENGIMTFEEVARLSPVELDEILQLRPWQKVDLNRVQTEARGRARGTLA
jgi:predicted flap endonuclease-1-like 5' DNA nuclease